MSEDVYVRGSICWRTYTLETSAVSRSTGARAIIRSENIYIMRSVVVIYHTGFTVDISVNFLKRVSDNNDNNDKTSS